MTHNFIQTLIGLLTTRFAQDWPKNILSVNIKNDQSVAWIKLNFVTNIPGNLGGAILDTAKLGQEHTDKVLFEVNAPGWYPEELSD